jgi:RNA polymerase-binding transcription factor DksA
VTAKATKAPAAVEKAPAKKAAAKSTPASKAAPASKATPASTAAPAKNSTSAKKPAPAKAPGPAKPASKAAVNAPAKAHGPAKAKAAPAKAKAAPARLQAPVASVPAPASVPTPAPAVEAAAALAVDRSEFFERQREALVAERATYLRQATSLRAEAEQLAEDREPCDVQFDEESGQGDTMNVERERDLALSAQAMTSVQEIDRALVKIANGTYGKCERCGQDIPEERLEALPHAALCVRCKSGSLSSRR